MNRCSLSTDLLDRKGRRKAADDFSSWGTGGYTVGIAESDSGKLFGNWHHLNKIICKDSGHGMGLHWGQTQRRRLAVHAPNDTPNERPVFLYLDELRKES